MTATPDIQALAEGTLSGWQVVWSQSGVVVGEYHWRLFAWLHARGLNRAAHKSGHRNIEAVVRRDVTGGR